MIYLIILSLVFFGAISGSFAIASVWRLRSDQLAEEKPKTKEYKKLVETNKLNSVGIKNDYSRCLNCGHRLVWYDLIPIISWLSLLGKCRYCGKKIGYSEIIAEICLALLFCLSYFYLNLSFLSFGIWVGLIIIATILFAYDFKWMLLPTKILYMFIVWSLFFAISQIYQVGFLNYSILVEYAMSVVILAGIYGLLWLISKGNWVGSGDIYLGVGLGLILGDWLLAFVTLFVANLIGTVTVFLIMIIKKNKIKTRIPLGPLLIMGTLLVFFFQKIIKNYFYFY